MSPFPTSGTADSTRRDHAGAATARGCGRRRAAQPAVPSAPATTSRPNRVRLAILVWLAVWPLITTINAVTAPALAGWPAPVRTMIATAIMVPIMVGVLLPSLQRRFRRWLAH